jgi:hypothetical protein
MVLYVENYFQLSNYVLFGSLLKSPSVNSYLFSEAFSTTKQRLSLQARLERGPTFFVKHFSFNVLSITNIPVFETISTVLEDLGPMLKKLFFIADDCDK